MQLRLYSYCTWVHGYRHRHINVQRELDIYNNTDPVPSLSLREQSADRGTKATLSKSENLLYVHVIGCDNTVIVCKLENLLYVHVIGCDNTVTRGLQHRTIHSLWDSGFYYQG